MRRRVKEIARAPPLKRIRKKAMKEKGVTSYESYYYDRSAVYRGSPSPSKFSYSTTSHSARWWSPAVSKLTSSNAMTPVPRVAPPSPHDTKTRSGSFVYTIDPPKRESVASFYPRVFSLTCFGGRAASAHIMKMVQPSLVYTIAVHPDSNASECDRECE